VNEIPRHRSAGRRTRQIAAMVLRTNAAASYHLNLS